MNNEDEEVWRINFKEKEKLSGKTLFSICLSDNPDYIAVYLLDGNWLFIVNRNDFSYKIPIFDLKKEYLKKDEK